jgi:crotonobetainyl-CoA:carnitine CoA-transferase CaiB-like acyl-CoA transferase
MMVRAETGGEKDALSGIVVLDFTWVIAGPQATRLLGAWGAEVIKVEWPERPDLARFIHPPPNDVHLDRATSGEASGLFNDFNVNKLGVTLNMSDARGRALFEKLLKRADVLAENFSPMAMEKWGYTYEALHRINPRLVYLSLSGYGHSGRDRQYVTYGPSAQALGGLTFGAGLPGIEPAGWGYSYLDQVGGYIGALGVAMALIEREKSGQGQQVDLAQSEAGLPLNGPAFLDYTVNGRPGRRPGFPPGNRSTWPGAPQSEGYRSEARMVPHNSYRCAGTGINDWCVIAVRSDEEWRILCDVIGAAELRQAKFSTLEGRLAHQEQIDRLIGNWTIGLDKYGVMAVLQAAGIASAAVQSSADRIERDPQLKARGLYKELSHPVLGTRLFQQVPVKMSKTPPTLRKHAPLIGSANADVWQRLAGLSTAEIADFVKSGVLWPKNMDAPPWIQSGDNVSSDASAAPGRGRPRGGV